MNAHKPGEDCVTLCPLHAQAPAMVEALRDIIEHFYVDKDGHATASVNRSQIDNARAILAEIEGKE